MSERHKRSPLGQRAGRYLRLIGGLLVSLFFFGTVSSSAQSLGELARQERERRQSKSKCARRVYTNDDLARPQILDQQTRSCYEAARRVRPAPYIAPPIVAGLEETRLPPVPFGALGRQLREERAAQVKQEVVKIALPPQRPPRAAATEQRAAGVAARLRPAHRLASPQGTERRVPTTTRLIRVQRGDTLWKLAQQHLGSGFRWNELAATNPQITNPDLIFVGQEIRLPPADTSKPMKQFHVQAGDTLWQVAKAEFGNGLAWPCIAQANPQLPNADLIYPGQMLTIPADCTSTS